MGSIPAHVGFYVQHSAPYVSDTTVKIGELGSTVSKFALFMWISGSATHK